MISLLKKGGIMKRQIAIISDIHALLEPTEAIINDINKRGITEIISLGDNIGLGPNPKEVIELLEDNNVLSIAGNYEDSLSLGFFPFSSYMSNDKIRSNEWTKEQLTKKQLESIKDYPHFLYFYLGGKKIALCHFINDVRFDFKENSALTYRMNKELKNDYLKQFTYPNTIRQMLDVAFALNIDLNLLTNVFDASYMFKIIRNYYLNNKEYYQNKLNLRGYLSFLEDPLFWENDNLKKVTDYNLVIQGHFHFKEEEKLNDTLIYFVRAAGMGYKNPKDKNMASYIILKEEETEVKIEEVLIPFDYEKMAYSIRNINTYDNTIATYTRVRKK